MKRGRGAHTLLEGVTAGEGLSSGDGRQQSCGDREGGAHGDGLDL
jgi:hypothetical protein